VRGRILLALFLLLLSLLAAATEPEWRGFRYAERKEGGCGGAGLIVRWEQLLRSR